MGTKYLPLAKKGTISSVIDAIQELMSLGEEFAEMVSNSEGTGLRNTAVMETRSETADILTSLSEPEIPDSVSEKEIEWVEQVPRRKTASRAVRRDNAVSCLHAAADSLREMDEEEASDLADSLEETISEADGCEFPGMFG